MILKTCVDCIYHTEKRREHICVRPTGALDLVTGGAVRNDSYCFVERKVGFPCGPEGKFWQRKPKTPSWKKWLWL